MSVTSNANNARPTTGLRNQQREFEDTFRPLMPELYNYLRRRTDTAEDAADCLSETLEVLWRKRAHLPTDHESLRRWSFGIARKVAQAEQRRHQRRTALDDAVRAEFTEMAPPARNESPDLLAALSPRDRELVELVVIEGFPIQEAGKILGLRPGAARMRYSRARSALRATIQDTP